MNSWALKAIEDAANERAIERICEQRRRLLESQIRMFGLDLNMIMRLRDFYERKTGRDPSNIMSDTDNFPAGYQDVERV